MAESETLPVIRIFVSSPADVLPERDRVDRVVHRLNVGLHGIASIETVRWEQQYFTADATFQAQILDAGACDLVVSIFWQRLGTPLPENFETMPDGRPYPSGTVYEVMKALEAQAKSASRLPDVLVYRKLADAATPMTDRRLYQLAHEQREAFLRFWDEWFLTREGQFKAAYNTFQTTDEFEPLLEQHLRDWLAARGYLTRRRIWPIAQRGSPFRGLDAFGREDEEIFFGRQRELAHALARLDRALSRGCGFLLMVGGSGSGKSSLARAGLAPKLLRNAFVTDVASWRYAEVRPRAPLPEVIAAAFYHAAAVPELAGGDFRDPGSLAALLEVSGDAAVAPVLRALDRAGADAARRINADKPVGIGLVLVLDQMEDLLVAGSEALGDQVAAFLHGLASSGRVLVVATLRSDSYARLVQRPPFLALKDAGETLDVGAPDAVGVADIVRGPADVAGLGFGVDPATGNRLDETIIAAATGTDALPLLEFSLTRLFNELLARLAQAGHAAAAASAAELVLAYEDYTRFGGLEGAVAEAAEQAYAGVSPAAQASLPRLLRGMAVAAPAASASPGTALRIIDVARRELAPDAASEELVGALIAARILAVGGQDVEGGRVRLAHEAVLRSWPRARDSVAESLNFFRVRAEVDEARIRWQRHREQGARRSESFLLSAGVPLAEADDMRRRFAPELSAATVAFIDLSSARARRRQRLTAIAAGVFAITAAGAAAAAGLAWTARNQAAANAVLARANADKSLQNFHAAADEVDALVVGVVGELSTAQGVSQQTVHDVLEEAKREIDALAARDPTDIYIAQVRSKTLAMIATNYIDLGDIASAKAILPDCLDNIRSRPQASWDLMDRQVVALCYSVAERAALAENKLDVASDLADEIVELNAEDAKQDNSFAAARNLSVAVIDQADILVQEGKLADATTKYNQALQYRRELLADDPTNEQAKDDVAAALDRVGNMAASAGQIDAALASYNEALDLSRQLAQSDPQNTTRQVSLSIALAKVASEYMRAGRAADAIVDQRECADIRRKLAASDTTNQNWQSLEAEGVFNLGLALSRAGQTAEGEASLAEGLADARAVAAHDPKNVDAHHTLAIFLNQAAGIALSHGDHATALSDAHESLDLLHAISAGGTSAPATDVDTADALLTVADAGEDTQKNYQMALTLLESADQKGALPGGMKPMMQELRSVVAARTARQSPGVSSAPPAAAAPATAAAPAATP